MLIFDRDYYLAQNPDVAASGMDAEMHYRQYGYLEGRDPSPDFDTSYYLMHNPEVEALGVNPFDHYNSVGVFEGRDPKAGVDAAFQLSMGYADVVPMCDVASDAVVSFDTLHYIEVVPSPPIASEVPMDVVSADVALDSDMVLPIDVAVEPILFASALPAPDNVLVDGVDGNEAFDATGLDDVMDDDALVDAVYMEAWCAVLSSVMGDDDVGDVLHDAYVCADTEGACDVDALPLQPPCVEQICIPAFGLVVDSDTYAYPAMMQMHTRVISDDRRRESAFQPLALTRNDILSENGVLCARASPKRVNVASIGVDVPRDCYASYMPYANSLPFG